MERLDRTVLFHMNDGNTYPVPYASAVEAQAVFASVAVAIGTSQPGTVPSITQAWETNQGIAGGFPTVIIGFNFKPGADIQINGVSQASITFLDSRTYAFITQPIGGGTYAVVYIGPDAQTATLPNAISFT